MAARISRRLARLRERIVARIVSVNQVTERETLSAGRALGTIVSVAREQIASLKRTVAAATEGELQREVEQLAVRVRVESVAIRDALIEHQLRLARASERATTIAGAARAVDTLTHEARVLAINACIEAQRDRGQTSGMQVIAAEMQRLAKAIGATNATIQELAADLGTMLPAIASEGAKVVAASTEFEAAASQRIAHIETHAVQLETGVRQALAAADTSLARILSESQAALSHLQFQDVCGQRLLETDLWTHEVHVEAARAEQATEPVSPPVQLRVGDRGSAPAVAQPSGDVVLF